MRKSTRPLVIAARPSHLARRQAQMIGQMLLVLDATLRLEFRWIESEGDRTGNVPLAQTGGKGLFVRAVEAALLDGQADLAVHSLKDLPSRMTPGLTLAAVPPRADVRDCLVSAAGCASIQDLPQGACVGTASPRRAAQLRSLRPDLRIDLLRGNIETRLRKVLQERQFDATLLAVAGLQRAGLAQHAAHPIDPDVMLPAACQGALALQCRGDDHVTLRRCLPLNDPASAAAVHAERQVVAALKGDCHSPIAVLVDPAPDDAAGPPSSATARQDRGLPRWRLRARAWSPDGQRSASTQRIAPARQLARLVKLAVADLRQQDVQSILSGC